MPSAQILIVSHACNAQPMTGVGQTRLFDNVDAMSAAPSIAAECCSAVFGASGHQLQKGAVHSITIVGAGKQFWADRSSLKSEFNLTCHKAHLRLPS